MLPPLVAVEPRILDYVANYTVGLGLSVKAWRMAIVMAALGGAGIIGGIWLLVSSFPSQKSN
jgi:hypothetical protein